MATTFRLARLLWVLAALSWVGVWLLPLGTMMTRLGGIALFAATWLGLLLLVWRHRVLRFGWMGCSVVFAVFFALPIDRHPDAESVRRDYVAGLRRYEGATYFWGGESPKGIDCSGLIRRGLIDAMFLRGMRTLDPASARRALHLWWNDCTARELGAGHGLTSPLFDAASINALDSSSVQPGDLAIAGGGSHILAYIGEDRWIEADPGIERVIVVRVPSADNPWFAGPVKLVRWNVLK